MHDEQTSIFDTPVEKMYRRQGPETSRAAAKVAKFGAGSQKQQCAGGGAVGKAT
jgi:hypothetical protein